MDPIEAAALAAFETRMRRSNFAGDDAALLTIWQKLPEPMRAAYIEEHRAAIAAYLRAEARRRKSTEGGGWCEVLAAEVERQKSDDAR